MMDLGRRKTGKLMEKIIVQKLHEIEEKEHGKILLAGQWIGARI